MLPTDAPLLAGCFSRNTGALNLFMSHLLTQSVKPLFSLRPLVYIASILLGPLVIAEQSSVAISGHSAVSISGHSPVSENEIETMIVSGTYTRAGSDAGKPQKLSISTDQIELVKPSTVTSLLRTLPGVNVTQQGGENGLTFISLRGGEPNFTVVIIDGVKVNDPTNSRGGGFDLAGLDPMLVKNIDVFLGGFSSIYGSEALGGVVSISTYDSGSIDHDVRFEVGSDNAYATALRWNGDLANQVEYNLAVVKRRAAESVPGDQLEREQIRLQLFSAVDAPIQWSGSWFYSEGDARGFPEDSGGDQWAQRDAQSDALLDNQLEVRSFRQNNLRIAATGLVGDHWALDAAISQSTHEENIDTPAIAEGVLSAVPAYVSDTDYQRRDLSLIANNQLENVAIAVGAEFSREQGKFESVIDFGFPIPADFELVRDNVALFAEAIVNLSPDLTVSGSLRRDEVEEFQQQTHALQATYDFPLDSGTLSLRYGEGFKVPSFFALGHPLVGNDSLQPEESENISLSYSNDLLDKRVNFTTSVYQNSFTNLVDFDPELFTNVNRSKIDVEGIESQLRWNPNGALTFDTSITYSEYDALEDVILRRRPEWKYGASAFWTINALTDVSLRAWYVDEFYDSSIPTGIQTSAGYHQLDASVARTLNERFEFGVVISNLTGSDYQEAVGFSNSGRQLRLSLTAKL